MRTLTSLPLAVLALCGCAGVQLSGERLERSEASIHGAEALGAADVPEANAHLQLAREGTDTARRLAAAGDARAPLVLAAAQADAELAVELAREPTVHAQALRAGQELDAVRARPAP